jgi:hypothetical protein
MTDLSPAAQYIVNAAVESGGGYGRATPVLHARLAAALRAAADQLAYGHTGRLIIDEKALLAIADELEAQ